MKIDPLILGHNQFIGVDHFPQDRARDRVQLFSETQKIIDIVTTFHKTWWKRDDAVNTSQN